MTSTTTTDQELKLPSELTQEELQKLYEKYNITENDIKFVLDELPNPLDGTILDGNKKVIVTEDGKLSKDMRELLRTKGIGYDIIISEKGMREIMENARKKFIAMYGVDPTNPKVEIMNGVPVPKEYARELIRSGKVKPIGGREQVGTLGSPSTGPHAINGKIIVHIFAAKDDSYGHAPESVYGTWAALSRFEQRFGVDMVPDWWFGYWDLSNVGNNASEALDDLEHDCNWIIDARNDIVLGWADNLDHNGVANPDGIDTQTGAFAPDAVCTETPTYPLDLGDWPEDSVVQHETSHLFNADDQGWWWWEHPECIMNYWYAYTGTDVWCDSCASTINKNIWV